MAWDASDRGNERSNAIAKSTFRVGKTIEAASILPSANNERVPRANHRAFISPLTGGRMVANGGSAPSGGRREDACPYGSE